MIPDILVLLIGNMHPIVGHNLYAWSFAHTVRIDKYDNIWVSDKGSDMVIKFNPQGQVIMVFGRKQEASDEGTEPLRHPKPPLPPIDGLFRQVTDMAWDAADDTFISDGYINSRVAKYDKNGKWIKSFGEPGSGPGQLNTPHSIATDAQGSVYVANRGNAASRCSTATASTCVRSRSACRLIMRNTPVRPSATSRPTDNGHDGARRAMDDLHNPGAPSSAVRIGRLSPAGSTSSVWTGRFWAYLESQANNSSTSDGSTRLRARRRPKSTSRNC